MNAVTIIKPRIATPLIYDSPHSGREYPDDWKTAAARDQLRLGEDAYVDELIRSSVEIGATVLSNNFPRSYIDVNREATDIDPDILSDEWAGELSPTEKSLRGLGLIRRYIVPGVQVLDDKISSAEVSDRIDKVYRPYHAALEGLIEETLVAFGKVWYIDWHSMKSRGNAMTPDGPGAVRADFVVSDGQGATSSPALVNTIVVTLESRGFSVSVNDPYKGGTLVRKFGKPERGIHAVQIEINRALYLDESRVERNSGFEKLVNDIEHLTSVLING